MAIEKRLLSNGAAVGYDTVRKSYCELPVATPPVLNGVMSEKDLSKLGKSELILKANEMGIKINEDFTRIQLIDVISKG